jgi:hypothetical protein
MDLPNFWIVKDPAALGDNLVGFRKPDSVAALLIEGLSTDDGVTLERVPFGGGEADGILVVLSAETATKLYDRMEGYIQSRKARDENVPNDNEAVVAKWALTTGDVALFVADTRGMDFAQDALETFMGLDKIPLHSSNKAVMSQRFDAAALLAQESEGGEYKAVFSNEVRQALTELAAPPAPAPKRRAGPR